MLHHRVEHLFARCCAGFGGLDKLAGSLCNGFPDRRLTQDRSRHAGWAQVGMTGFNQMRLALYIL
eukprot:359706-Chlamydomonas_euryale.AAC.1